MAQTGYTPIQLYYSTTASAVPTNTNLANGELAINITDGKLYYKDNTGTVKLLAGATSGPAGGSNTQVQYNSSGVLAGSSNLTFDGTSLTLGGNPTLSAGTANGVTYLNGSKVLTSGSALTFDGTDINMQGSAGFIVLGIEPATTIGSSGTNFIHGVNSTNIGFKISTVEQMRLTSTGLGIGTSSPSSKLDVSGVISLQGTTLPSAGTARIFSRSSDSSTYIQNATGGSFYLLDGSQNTMYGASPTLHFWSISNSEKMRLDSAGNLGLGVTPSAWRTAGGEKALQVGPTLTAYSNSGGDVYWNKNWYLNSSSQSIYLNNGYAQSYGMVGGEHRWYTAASGAAGNTISFTQAMTLDASGNLGLGVTPSAAAGYTTFDVSNATSGARIRLLVGSTPYGIFYTNGTTDVRLQTAASVPLLLGTNYNEYLRIAPSGAFGLSGANYGSSGQVLTSQGSGSPPIWASGGGGGGGSPAGSTGQFQYNNAGSFAAAPSMMSANSTNVNFDPTSTNHLDFFRYVNNSGDSIRWFNETTGPYYYSLENYYTSPYRGLVWGNNYNNPAGWTQVMSFINMRMGIGTKTPSGGSRLHVQDDSNSGGVTSYVQGNSGNGASSGTIAFEVDMNLDNASSNTAAVYIKHTNVAGGSPTGGGLITAYGGFASTGGNLFKIYSGGGTVGFFNNVYGDGTLIDFQRQGTVQGSITVSGSTVSYNSFCGAHWSQLQQGRGYNPEILRGTIVSSLDELCVWKSLVWTTTEDIPANGDVPAGTVTTKHSTPYLGDLPLGSTVEEDGVTKTVADDGNERLPMFKISDTVGDKTVYGAFQCWDAVGDANISSLGAYPVRIAAGVTVQRGDLIESNGDGCGKVQADDTIRSSTVCKVTSNTVIDSYEDGSYTVPCVIYCG